MNRKLRRAVFVLLALVFAVSASRSVYQLFQYKQAEEIYAEAEDLVQMPDLDDLPLPEVELAPPAVLPDASTGAESEEPAPVYVDPYADALAAMDFSALQEVNRDVKGWILVPGTGISYPLLQGQNNDHYLRYSWRNTRNNSGSIFLDSTNSSSLSDFNTIVYGHQMRNNSMFGLLHAFRTASYWKAHPCVYITNSSGSYRYEIFAAYEVKVTEDTYRLGFPDTQSKQDYIDFCLSRSSIQTGIVPHTYDYILTMSTCTGRAASKASTRWVVQAVRWGTPPEEPAAPEPEPIPEPAPQPEEGQVPDASQTPDTSQVQPPEAQPPDVQSPDTQSPDVQTPDVQAPDTQMADAQAPEEDQPEEGRAEVPAEPAPEEAGEPALESSAAPGPPETAGDEPAQADGQPAA